MIGMSNATSNTSNADLWTWLQQNAVNVHFTQGQGGQAPSCELTYRTGSGVRMITGPDIQQLISQAQGGNAMGYEGGQQAQAASTSRKG